MASKRGKNPKSLKNLKKPWEPGISGNISGRPKKPITAAYSELADMRVPGDKKKRTYAQLVALAQFNAAIKGKRTEAAREIANRIEGPAEKPQIELIPGNDPIRLRVEAPDLISTIRAIYGLGASPSDPDSPQPPEAKPVSAEMDRGQEQAPDSDKGT
jgi:hypothetical protein